MKALIKYALALLLLGSAAQASAAEIWIPGTALGGKLEYVTLNTNRYAIDSLGFWFHSRTRVEFGFESDTTTYFVLPDQFDGNQERSLEVYRTLRDAMINKIPVNVQVDGDTRDFLQIRLGVTDHPLAIGQRSVSGGIGEIYRKDRIDLLGRNRNSAPGLSWQANVPARR